MADCIDTGFLQFSCTLVQVRYSITENGCGHILKAETSSGKKVRERGNWEKCVKGKRGWGYLKGNSGTGGITNKKKYFQLY